jgi:6-pyruvoyltetrahydropterin/6-carboxytetrahydropterin synthase
MYEVTVEQSFAAAHALRDYKGACERLHGHNFKVHVTIEGQMLDKAGMLVDFLDVKALMLKAMERLDHYNLNDVPPFDAALNPSAENIARYIHDEMARDLTADGVLVRVQSVKVWETDIQSATYRP